MLELKLSLFSGYTLEFSKETESEKQTCGIFPKLISNVPGI
jgi:hypothetical protein